MPECICPSCNTFFSAPSSAFGERYHCASCGTEFKLDVVHLARYRLPNLIRLQLENTDGTPFTRFAVPVMVEYGYRLPPLRTNAHGQIMITKQMFLKAQYDEISTGIMDHKGDYSLTRYIRIRILGKNEADARSKARSNSPYPILSLEKELYGDMRSLAAAYIPEEDILPIEIDVDLSKANDVVNLEMPVSLP
jgi:hypothetical protein